MPRVSAVLGALFFLTLSGTSAASDGSPIAMRLELHTSAACATRAALAERVRARAPRIRFVDDAAAPVVRVNFAALPSGSVTSDVSVSRPGAQLPTRRMEASSCADAVDAVALIIVVTLDPASTFGDSDNESGSSPTADSAPQPTPARPKDRENSETVRSSPAAEAGGSQARGARGPNLDASFMVQLSGEALLGPVPGILPGVAARFTAALDRSSLWAPALSIGGIHAVRSDVEQEGGHASFILDGATLEAYPAHLRTGMLEGRLGAAGLLGQLRARGTDTRNPASPRRLFATTGASALLGLRLHRLFELSLRVGAGFTLVRDSFEFAPVVFHTAAPVTFSGGFGLTFRLP